MLATHYQELLTASVDGELTARQRRAVARLLRRSGEARLLLQRLQEDARQLKGLSAPPLPGDLSGSVLELISQRGLKPVRRLPMPVAQSGFSAWPGVAAAAAVLLLVGVGSFLQSSRSTNRTGHDSVKRHENPEEGPRVGEDLVKSPILKGQNKESPPVRGHKDIGPGRKNPEGVPEKEKPKAVPRKEKTDPVVPPEGVLASGEKEASGKLEQVELALPEFFKLHDLDQAGPAGKLLQQLGRSNAFRIELLCKDASRGFDRIQSAFTDQKMGLVIDPTAQARLKIPQWKHDYALFFENMKAGDLVKFLGKVGQLDRTLAGDKKPTDLRFDGTVVVQRMSNVDRQELTGLLGVDPVRVRPEPPRGLPKIDIRQPLTENTKAAVDAAFAGKGVPRPTAESAVVVPMPNRMRTPELKRFLESRKPAIPETVQVFLVLRNVGP